MRPATIVDGARGITVKPMGAIEWGLLALLAVLWGGTFFLNEIAVAGLGPLTVVLGRVAIAALALTALVPAIGARMPTAPGTWSAFLVMGALNNAIPFSLIVWGQTHIDSGLAAIINATTPIFTVVLAHAVTQDERLTASRVVGVALGAAGVAVLVGGGALATWGWHSLGQVAVLGAAVSYACAGLYGRRFGGLSPVVAAAGMLWGSTLLMAPVTVVVEAPWRPDVPINAWLAVGGLALAGTAVAYVVYFGLLARAGATNLLLVTFLMPVVALVLGICVHGETVSVTAWVGLAMILAGLAAIDGRAARRLAGPGHPVRHAPLGDSGHNSGRKRSRQGPRKVAAKDCPR